MENRILLKDAVVGKKYKINHSDVIACYIGGKPKYEGFVFKYISGKMTYAFADEENLLFVFWNEDTWTHLTEIE